MGESKAWLRCGGETLLQRVVRLVAEAVGPVVVAARSGQALPDLPSDVDVVCDVVAEAGPLAGIAAGFEALADRCEAALVCSCDHPLLDPGLLGRLVGMIDEAPAIVPEHGGRLYPLVAVYRFSTKPILLEMLAQKELRVHDFVRKCNARVVPSAKLGDSDPNRDSLKNVNDPLTYARLVGTVAD